MNNPDYVLGHSDRELSRLTMQARLLEPVTRQFLLDAEIRAGMGVLDIGSRAGDVAFLAAELVGRSGEVIGTDAAAVTAAMLSACERGLSHVSYREGDSAQIQFDRSFDAVIGRDDFGLSHRPNNNSSTLKCPHSSRPPAARETAAPI